MNFEEIIQTADAQAAALTGSDSADYVKDGLLHCGKCHTPKQCYVDFRELFGEIRKQYCLCKCAKERRDREEQLQKERELLAQVQKYRAAAFPESDMAKWNFAADDGTNEKMTRAMKNYVEHFAQFREQGKGLLLFGPVGTGKTFLAACAANALIDRGTPCMVTNFARIANTVQGLFDGRQAYYDSFNRFPLLVLDDLKAERQTEYMQEIVFNVIDARYRAKLPLIITTNLTREELMHPQDVTDQRIFSRLFEMCTPIEVTGADRRHKALKENIAATKQLLGL